MSTQPMVISWNIRRLGDHVKNQAVLSTLLYYNPAIACLQETHMVRNVVISFHKAMFKTQHYATYSSYARGGRGECFELFISNVSCRQSLLDQEGCFVLLVCILHHMCFILANIYVPPSYSNDALKKLLRFMAQYTVDPRPGGRGF